MEMDDKKIIKFLKSNDESSINCGFEALYSKYSKLIYVCIHKYIKRREDIEDILSDTFLKVFENRMNLKDTKNFKYYLTTTATNLSINFLKRKSNDYNLVENEDLDIYYKDYDSDIRNMIEKLRIYLDEDEISIIINHLIYAYTFEDMAKAKNESVNTIKTKYYRALKKVKK